MIIVVGKNGDTKTIIPEDINQGSNNANIIYLIAPFPKNVQVNISFLVNEVVLPSYLMEQSESISDTLNTWKIELESPITQYYGIVKYTFYATNTQGETISTGRGQFKVNQGVDFQLPEKPDDQTYELILQKLSDIDADILNGWTQSMGIYPYNAKFEYNLGAIVFSEDRFYTSLVNNNLGNSLEDATKWRMSTIVTSGDVTISIEAHNSSESSHPYLINRINGIIDGSIPLETKIKEAQNAVNVTQKINGVNITDIFESNGKTVKKATNDANGNNISTTYQTKSNLVTQWQATPDNQHYPSEALVKTYIDSKTSSVYRYKGSVATYNDLPTENLQIGDVYDVKDTGMNYAWNGTSWDELGMNIDASLFELKENKVTSISSASTDTEYPSAKCMYDIVGDISSVLAGVVTVQLPDYMNARNFSFDGAECTGWVGENNINEIIIPKSYSIINGDIVDGNDYQVTSIKGGNYVSGFTNYDGRIILLKGITSINDCAFYNSNLTSIDIADDVITIGDFAFSGCDNLTEIAIPNSVTSIGSFAFAHCNNLKFINFGENSQITSIANTAFDASINFTSFVGTGNDYYLIDECRAILIDDDGNGSKETLLVYATKSDIDTYSIPNSVTTIRDGVFYNCFNLKSVELSPNITLIGQNAFLNCTGLNKLTGVGNNYYSIDNEKAILIDEDGDGTKETLFAYAIANTSSSYSIPYGITKIKDAVFYNCSYIQEITIPSSISVIGQEAFLNCSYLTTMKIEATTPPTLANTSAISTATTQIQVPSASVEAYKTATNWSNFADIIVGY